MMEKTMTGRQLHMDILRIIAILCVLYNHTNERGYYLYAFPSSEILHIFYIVVAALIAVAVPIFFMISGALLLPKQESLQALFRKRVLRMVLVLVIFSCLQFAVGLWEGRAELTLTYFMQHLFTEGMIPPYWFLYAYLAYLLVLPFLRKLITVMSKQDFLYLFALLLVVEGVLPLLLYPFGITELNSFFVLPLLDRVVVYPLLGYYLEHYITENQYNRKNDGKMLLAMLAVLVIFVIMTDLRALPYEEFTTYDKGLYTCSLTMVLDVGVYYFVKRLCLAKGWNQQQGQEATLGRKIITSLGSATFGIYLVELPIRRHTAWICDDLKEVIAPFPACMVWILCIAIIAYGVTMVMKCIPGLRRLL